MNEGSGPPAPTKATQVWEAADHERGLELCQQKGWTDGHPVVLPTEEKVRQFLGELNKDGDEVVARSEDRNRTIRVRHVVVNSIMAGCRPAEVPVVSAAVQAVLSPPFRHNHLASLGGPWPFFIVSGPIVDQIGLNYDQYVLGPGSRVNSVIARAISLVFWNCLDQRPGGVQRGAFGAAWRNESILPERPDSRWSRLHEDRGFPRDASTVTAFPATGFEQVLVHLLDSPEHILAPIIDSLATGRFVWGPYVIVLPPNMVAVCEEADWTKQAVVTYLTEQTQRSVAQLKRRTRWAEQQAGRRPWSELLDVQPGDEEKMVYLFKRQPELYDIAFRDKFLDSRDSEILLMCSGGTAGLGRSSSLRTRSQVRHPSPLRSPKGWGEWRGLSC